MPLVRTKILFVIPDLGGGGAQRVFSHLLRHIDRARFEPHLALLNFEGGYLRDLPEDVVVHKIGGSRVRYALPGIVRVAHRVKPKVILATLPHINVSVILAKPFLPKGTLVFVREPIPPSEIGKEEDLENCLQWMTRHLYRRADLVISPSQAVRDEVVRHYRVASQKAVLIYNPMDVGWIRQTAAAGDNPYSGNGPHLVAVGRLARQKGFDVLLPAMRRVSEAFPEARLAILGEGALRSELESQAKALGLNGTVRFWGFQQNPWSFIEHADLFVLSSRYEGLPNALLEALALGKAAVATNCAGVSELQTYFPEMTLVPPENPDSLAQGIIAACRSFRAQAGNSNSTPSEAALATFGLQSVVEQYSRLFLS